MNSVQTTEPQVVGGTPFGSAPSGPSGQKIIALADKLTPLLSAGPGGAPFNTKVRLVEGMLEEGSVDTLELPKLLAELSRRGLVRPFLRLAEPRSPPTLRGWLRARGISWDIIFQYHEWELTDSIDFFAGFLLGAGKGAASLPVDLAQALQAITKSAIDQRLAKDTKAFFGAIGQLLTNPNVLKRAGKEWFARFEERVLSFEFFQAGAQLGEFVYTILDLIRLAPSAARAARFAAALVARKLQGPALAILIGASELNIFLKSGAASHVTSTGLTIERATVTEVQAMAKSVPSATEASHELAELAQKSAQKPKADILAITLADGSAAGAFTEPITPKYLAEITAMVDRWAASLGPDGPHIMARAVAEGSPLLKIDTNAVIDYVIGKVNPTGKTALVWGKEAHEAAEAYWNLFLPNHPYVNVYVERELVELLRPGSPLAEITVSEFLRRYPVAAQSLAPPKALLKQTIGKMSMDMCAIDRLNGTALIWDLTSKPFGAHFKKTLLYLHILTTEYPSFRPIDIVESFYKFRGVE